MSFKKEMSNLRKRKNKIYKKIPWKLELKDNMIKFYDKHKIKHPKVYKIFNNIEDLKSIILNLPNEFVLKPTTEFSSNGVMVLKKSNENLYFEFFLEKYFSLNEIIDYQKNLQNIYSNRKNRPKHKQNNYKFIIDEKIYNIYNDFFIPCDYKCFTFYGEMILVVKKKNGNKTYKTCWYDKYGNYIPHYKILNKKYNKITEQLEFKKIKYFEDMKKIAEYISKIYKLPFCRIDFFINKEGVYVGEFGYIVGGKAGGHEIFNNKYDKILGEKWLKKEKFLNKYYKIIKYLKNKKNKIYN